MGITMRNASRFARKGYTTARTTAGTALRLTNRSVSTIRQYGWRVFYDKVRRKIAGPMIEAATVNWKEGYLVEAFGYAQWLDFTPEQLRLSQAVTAANHGALPIASITWFLPHFEHAYYGGVFTILRFAAHFAKQHQVYNTFVIISHPNGPSAEAYLGSIVAAYPDLTASRVIPVRSNDDLKTIRHTDALVATSWITAYYALKYNDTRRKFYFIQDFEPIFHPAGSTSAQAEATYRFSFYGLTNTVTLKQHYVADYSGQATFFNPCVDTHLFYPPTQRDWQRRPYRVFFYGRPNHWRNGFELGAIAMHKLKEQLGTHVQILAAGQDWDPALYGLSGVVENLGLMSYQQTAELYRTCDAGLAMMFTRHPSYLPFEFMASGCLVVSNINNANRWLLKDGENCLLTLPSASAVAETIARGLQDHELRQRITANAYQLIQTRFADWNRPIEHIYSYMCDPEGVADLDE